MNNKELRFGIVIVALGLTVVGTSALAQQPIYKAPTAADWAALAKLPDFSGVWEQGGVGGGGNAAFGTAPAPRGNQTTPPAGNRGAAPPRGGGAGGRGAAGPSFTPKYEAMRAAAARAPQPEDNATANCLPPGMPGIMTQPYPMEFLMTPGKVTIVIEAYT